MKIGGKKLLANEVPAARSMDLMSKALVTPIYGNIFSWVVIEHKVIFWEVAIH